MNFDGPYQIFRKVFREEMGEYWLEHNIAGQVMFGSDSPRIRQSPAWKRMGFLWARQRS